VLHLHRGTPFIYQGEELGMTNAVLSDIAEVRDVESLNYYADSTERLGFDPAEVMRAIGRVGRDNARTPMQWTAEENSGFTTSKPWIGVNENHRLLNADAERADPDSIFHYYRRLIELRHTDPIIESGSYRLLYPDDEHLFCFTRTSPEGEILVVANFNGERTKLPRELRSNWWKAEIVIENLESRRSSLPPHLEPWQVVVLRRSS
jgi:oligo-1,6-glucosidase